MKCILFIADAVRPDYLGCYGNNSIDTAAIDLLAEGGVRFKQVVSAAPWTAPSTASIVSGVYAHKHQIFTWDKGFPDNIPTLFELMAGAGHEVASFVFDQNYLFSAIPSANVQGNTGEMDQVNDWLLKNAHKEFLLIVHSWATHMPYQVQHSDRPSWKEAKRMFIEQLRNGGEAAVRSSQAAYAKAIEYCSARQIDLLLGSLRAKNILENTLFIFMSDHGESWGERFSDKSHIQGIHHLHGRFLYDETIMTPLIMHWPAGLPAGGVIPSQVRTVDIAPTILDAAGVSAGSWKPDGMSLLPLINEPDAPDRAAICATSEHGQLSKISLRQPPFKYIRTVDKGGHELYDLAQDPDEVNDVSGAYTAERARMSSIVDGALSETEQVALSADEEQLLIQRLEDLGYI